MASHPPFDPSAHTAASVAVQAAIEAHVIRDELHTHLSDIDEGRGVESPLPSRLDELLALARSQGAPVWNAGQEGRRPAVSETVGELVRRGDELLRLQAGGDPAGTAPLDPALAPAAVGAMLVFLGRTPDTVRADLPTSARQIVVGSFEITGLQVISGLGVDFLSTWERVVPLLSHADARLRNWAMGRLGEMDLPAETRAVLMAEGDDEVVEFDSAAALFRDLGI